MLGLALVVLLASSGAAADTCTTKLMSLCGLERGQDREDFTRLVSHEQPVSHVECTEREGRFEFHALG